MTVHSPQTIERLAAIANRYLDSPISTVTLATSAAHGWQHIAMHEMLIATRCEAAEIAEDVRQGTYNLVLTVNDGLPLGAAYDGQTWHGWSSAGQFSVIPPAGDCSWTTGTVGQACHFFLSPALFAEGLLALGQGDPERYTLPFLFNRVDPLIEQLCRALRAEMYAPSGLGPLYIDSLCQALALHLLRLGAAPLAALPRPAPAMTPAIRQAMAYIDAHADQPIALAELAAAAHISQATLCRQFRQATGMAPHQYLLRRRLDHAARFLRTGTYTVGQVAQMTGFADQGHLARWMRRLLGVAPRALLPARHTPPSQDA